MDDNKIYFQRKINVANVTLALVYGLICLIPFVSVYLFFVKYAQVAIFNAVPYCHYDPFDYYLSIKSFYSNGFSMGKFTFNEVLPAIQSSPFGAHGAMYSIIMSSIPAIFPFFGIYSAPVVNFFFISSALALALIVGRLSLWKSLCVSLLVVLYPDFFHHSATFWQEPLHVVFAILIAATFSRIIKDKHAETGMVSFLLCILLVATFIRPSWGVFFVPFFYIVLRGKSRRLLLSCILGGIVFLAGIILYIAPAAPSVHYLGPTGMMRIVLTQATSASERIHNVVSLVLMPIKNFLSVGVDNPWYLMGIFVCPVVALGVFFWGRRSRNKQALCQCDVKLLALIFLSNIVFCMLIAPIFSTQTLRYIYPHALASLVIIVALECGPFVLPFAFGLFAFFFLSSFQSLQNFAYDISTNAVERARRIVEFEYFASPILQRTASSNAWCNTVLKADFETTTELLGMPRGIGLSYILYQPDFKGPVKSRFVIVEGDKQIDFLRKSSHGLLYVTGSTVGDLYVNTDVACGDSCVSHKFDENELSNVVSRVRNSSAAAQARMLEKYAWGKYVEWRAVSMPNNSVLVEARNHVDVASLARGQLAQGMISASESEKMIASFDDMSLVMTFIIDGDSINFHDVLLYVHCDGGRFKYYMLPKNALDIIASNEIVPRVNYKYNDLDYDVCFYW